MNVPWQGIIFWKEKSSEPTISFQGTFVRFHGSKLTNKDIETISADATTGFVQH